MENRQIGFGGKFNFRGLVLGFINADFFVTKKSLQKAYAKAFFEIYMICTPLHRSALKYENNIVQNFADFFATSWNLKKCQNDLTRHLSRRL